MQCTETEETVIFRGRLPSLGDGVPEPIDAPDESFEEDVVAGYPLLDRLGAGGMGEVFLSCTTNLRGETKLIALKRLSPRFDTDLTMKALLVAESKLLRRIRHRGIVRALDVSYAATHRFFTMEYIDGWTLSDVLRAAQRRGVPIPVEIVFLIIKQVAQALHAVHETIGKDARPLGLIHADVSPSNIMVSREGHIRLIDFGAARGRHNPPMPENQVLGTLAYMAPEQIQDGVITRATDVFALGVLLWELTTLRRLFKGGTPVEIASRIARCDVPPPSDVRENYCYDLEDIVLRALRPIPATRYPTALHFDLALDRHARRKGFDCTRALWLNWLRNLDVDGVHAEAARDQAEQRLIA